MTIVKKLTKIGNSYGVILPKEVLTEAGIDEQAEVEVAVRDGEVVVRAVNMQDYKVMKIFLSVMKDYDPLLKKLAKGR